jgi:uncharacterized protein (DUF1810 family)
MADSNRTGGADDPFNLERFIQAQADDYERALFEIKRGRKHSHWMWYVFPQFDGLGYSATTKQYSIKSLAEAQAYLKHPVLARRLHDCCEAVLGVEGRSAYQIFGAPDDMKLKSCATLFASLSPRDSVFDRVLTKYFNSERDSKTLHLLGGAPRAE